MLIVGVDTEDTEQHNFMKPFRASSARDTHIR